jgi:hypothetical protein
MSTAYINLFALLHRARVSRQGAGPACGRIRLASSSPPPPRAASPPARSTRRPGLLTRIGARSPHLRAKYGFLPSLSSSTRRGSCERCRSGGRRSRRSNLYSKQACRIFVGAPLENLRPHGVMACPRFRIRGCQKPTPNMQPGREDLFSCQSSSGCRFRIKHN